MVENKVGKSGIFFGPKKVSVNSPRFTSNPPQLHHKITTINTHSFAKPPYKRPLSPQQKKLMLLCLKSDSTLLSKANRRRKLFYT
jgi:hypothetical protein